MAGTVPEHGADRSVDLLVALLTRYPELSAVHVSASDHAVELSFLILGAVDSSQMEAVSTRLRSGLNALCLLDKTAPRLLVVRHQVYDSLTRLVVRRHLSDLVVEEFAIILGIVKESFGQRLIVDEGETENPLLESCLDEEAIQDTLAALRTHQPGRELFAIRDGGRVLIFHEGKL